MRTCESLGPDTLEYFVACDVRMFTHLRHAYMSFGTATKVEIWRGPCLRAAFNEKRVMGMIHGPKIKHCMYHITYVGLWAFIHLKRVSWF